MFCEPVKAAEDATGLRFLGHSPAARQARTRVITGKFDSFDDLQAGHARRSKAATSRVYPLQAKIWALGLNGYDVAHVDVDMVRLLLRR